MQTIVLDPEIVNDEFVKGLDGKVVWVRDDYLCMRGIVAFSDPKLYSFLNIVADVKEKLSSEGYQFSDQRLTFPDE